MSRPFFRFAVALAPPLFAILVAAALASGGGLSQAIPHSSPGTAASYCYAWDLTNNTGQDASGLSIRLKGIQSISQVYTGTANPFGSPDPTSGYDPGTDVYTLVFSQGVAFDSDMVHIGLCADQPILQLAQQPAPPPIQWLSGGQGLQPAPLFAGAGWSWQNNSHAQLQLFNNQAVTMTLMELNVLDADTSLSLDDLNADVAGTLPMVSLLAQDPQSLPPGATSFFDVFFDAPRFDHPYVLQAVLAAEDDPGNVYSLFSQATSPPAAALVYLPLVMR
jgi:hypothetical protein